MAGPPAPARPLPAVAPDLALFLPLERALAALASGQLPEPDDRATLAEWVRAKRDPRAFLRFQADQAFRAEVAAGASIKEAGRRVAARFGHRRGFSARRIEGLVMGW